MERRLLVQVLMQTEFLRVIRVEAGGRLRVTSACTLFLLEARLQLLELGLLVRFHDVEALVVVREDLEVCGLINQMAVFINYLASECIDTEADDTIWLQDAVERYAAHALIRRENV